jgi:hypothetical protein
MPIVEALVTLFGFRSFAQGKTPRAQVQSDLLTFITQKA